MRLAQALSDLIARYKHDGIPNDSIPTVEAAQEALARHDRSNDMDIGCNISDPALLRNLAEDVPDMALSIRERLRAMADVIDARKPEAPLPALMEDMEIGVVPCAVGADGWLFVPHADGKWVTAAKLKPFGLEIIRHWQAEARQA